MKNKKEIYIITSIFLIILVICTFIINFIIAGKPRIESINISEKINNDLTKTITLKIHNPFNKDVTCAIVTKKETDKISINKITNLKINTDKIYLTLGETYKLKTEIESIGDVDKTLTYTVQDEKILKVEEGLITPLSNGTTKIKGIISMAIDSDDFRESLEETDYTFDEDNLIEDILLLSNETEEFEEMGIEFIEVN